MLMTWFYIYLCISLVKLLTLLLLSSIFFVAVIKVGNLPENDSFLHDFFLRSKNCIKHIKLLFIFHVKFIVDNICKYTPITISLLKQSFLGYINSVSEVL